MTDDQIRELCVLTTRNEAGRHFTEWAQHWEALEKAGLIRVDRPVHEPTGVSYSQEYYTLEVTEEGQDLVDANPELQPMPFHGQTVRDYWENHAGNTDNAPIEDWPGWMIEQHRGGLAVCSPGTSPRELGYPDDSDEDLEDFLRRANPDS